MRDLPVIDKHFNFFGYIEDNGEPFKHIAVRQSIGTIRPNTDILPDCAYIEKLSLEKFRTINKFGEQIYWMVSEAEIQIANRHFDMNIRQCKCLMCRVKGWLSHG